MKSARPKNKSEQDKVDEFMETLGTNLRVERTRRRMTQAQVAAVLGGNVTATTICSMENAKMLERGPSLTMLLRVCKVFGCDLYTLVPNMDWPALTA